MKADIRHRVNMKDHIALEKVIPLETPFVLLVDPSNLCNLQCKFCPSGDHALIRNSGRVQKNLDFDLFKKIIDDLKEFPNPIKTLRLYKEGEPLINPKFPDMIKYAKNSKTVLKIDTTTNGVLLNPKLNRRIINCGLDEMHISVNGTTSKQIQRVTNIKIDFKQYYNNIRDLYENRGDCKIYIKSIKQILSLNEQLDFFNIFGDISDKIYLENLCPVWPEFKFEDENIKFDFGNYGQPIIQRQVCPFIFYTMVINSDGKVSLCLVDWKHQLICGDVVKQSVRDIWTGETMNSFRTSNLKNTRSDNGICKECKSIDYCTFENLDPFSNEILQRFKP